MKLAYFCALVLMVSIPTVPEIVAAQSIEQLAQQADAALNRNQLEQAEAIWKTVLRRDPKNVMAYVNLGDLLRLRTRNQQAIEAYRKAISLAPEQVEAYLGLAELFRNNQNNPEAAIALYRRAIQVAAPNAQVYYMLGATLAPVQVAAPIDQVYYIVRSTSSSKRDEAIAIFRKAIEIDPKLSKAYVGLGIVLRSQGEFTNAMAAYQSAMNLDDWYAYDLYSGLLAEQNRLTEMIPLYQQAIQRNPKGPNVRIYHHKLAGTFEQLNRLDEATETYQKLVQLLPADPNAYFALGDVLRKQGKSDQAVNSYRKAAEVIRADSYSSRGSSYSYRMGGSFLSDRGQYDLAIATYRKAIALNSKDILAYAYIADALRLQGKLDEAIQTYRQSISINPQFSYAYRGLGQALQQQGKLEQAVQAYRKAQSLDPRDTIVRDRLREVEALMRSQKQFQKFTGDSVIAPSLIRLQSALNGSRAGFQFEDSHNFNEGSLVTQEQTKTIRTMTQLGRCVGTLYIPPTYATTTTVEKTPEGSRARFLSKTVPPAAGLRVIIRNVTPGIDQNPSPYTDREYRQSDRSESLIVKQGTVHSSRYFAMIPGLNALNYEIKRGNEIIEAGAFTAMMISQTREVPSLADPPMQNLFSDECESPKHPEIHLPEIPPVGRQSY
ncbi:tetratricopeptide repeat protein [Leptolyngbya sp. AN03gr2]|uniref:tetratricopeptide repeat protein n=1 Tax=unclassified Leptolyngbya TaxID=2650499 RepID=UPI003D310C4B